MPHSMDDGYECSQIAKPIHHGPSRIPAPKTMRQHSKNIENGFEKGDMGKDSQGNAQSGKVEHKRFEAFVMTGDMIIQKSSRHPKKEIPQPSIVDKSKKDTKQSPVPLKKDSKSKIARASDSPKISPKRKPATNAVIESPKSSPKRVVHSPPSPRKELDSPKVSPKRDTSKSPSKHSRLPRFTPKNSPKLTQKQLSTPKDSESEIDISMDTDDILVSTCETVKTSPPKEVVTVTPKDTNGVTFSPVSRPTESHRYELLGYARFADVPIELDIPPDDISSEDERFKHDDLLDIDELPPPPDEFFDVNATVIPDRPISPEIRPMVTRTPDPLPEPKFFFEPVMDEPNPQVDLLAFTNMSPRVTRTPEREIQEDIGFVTPDVVEDPVGDSDQSISDKEDQDYILDESNQSKDLEPSESNQSASETLDSSCLMEENNSSEFKEDVEIDASETSDTLPKLEMVDEYANEVNDNMNAHHDSINVGTDQSHSETFTSADGMVQITSFSERSPCELDVYANGSPHHNRTASVGDQSPLDTSQQSIKSDSRVDIGARNSPSRIVVSKSAEKIAPIKSEKKRTPPHNLITQTSKSHDNYLESNNDKLTFMDIDLEDNIASSVDALHYEKSSSSLESLDYVHFHDKSHSVGHSPDKQTGKFEKRTEKEHKLMPTFISLEEARSITKMKEGSKLRKDRDDSSSSSQSSPSKSVKSDSGRSPQSSPSHKPSAIPVRDSRGKPPKPPTRSAIPSPQKSELPQRASQPPQTISEMRAEFITGGNKEFDFRENPLDVSEPTSPMIESPLQTANSHMVHTDLPTDEEPPIATSSTPPSPSPDNEQPYLEQHQCGSDGNSNSPEEPFNLDAYHQPLKEIDRPSAARLAKRLYQLDGFKKRDITRHLCKKNDFSFLVGEEYLKFFMLENLTLDQALRTFLKNLMIIGETQERERVLAHFSRRYLECNPGSYNSEDACHTLVCALMLLNTDLHGQNIGRKMAVNEFVENLAELNDGDNFPKEVLKNLYHSIRDEPLECHFEDSDSEVTSERSSQVQDVQRYLGHNPFLDVPDPSKTTEYKKGYVMRKCCRDSEGRKTGMGKRGWKMFYATLRDMVLYLHKDDHAFKKTTMVANANNAIRIHHALAYRATDYKKKQHVLRLQTSDWAQYLLQTSNSKECQEWIDTINFVAASLSAPPLPGGCGSQKKFQRPLMPVSYTRLNLREQAMHHEQRMLQAEQDLLEHRKYPPDKGAKARIIQDYSEKETYLQFELRRFKVYSALLQMKLATYPELEPSLVESAIGEVDEPSSHPSSPEQPRIIPLEADLAAQRQGQSRSTKSVSRSMSDRCAGYQSSPEKIQATVGIAAVSPLDSNLSSPKPSHDCKTSPIDLHDVTLELSHVPKIRTFSEPLPKKLPIPKYVSSDLPRNSPASKTTDLDPQDNMSNTPGSNPVIRNKPRSQSSSARAPNSRSLYMPISIPVSQSSPAYETQV